MMYGLCPKYVIWYDHVKHEEFCKGKWFRTVCNFGVGDLERIHNSSCLFANKFNLDVSKEAVISHFHYVVNKSLNDAFENSL